MADFRINVVADPRGAVAGARQTEAALDRVGAGAGRLRASMARLFAGIAAGVSASFAVRTIANFEQALSTVRAATGANQRQFAALGEEARRLGARTRFGASQAADSMVLLGRAGLDANQVLAATGSVLLLAQAGALELASATEIGTQALRQFGLTVAELPRVVDVLALAANSSNTNVEQLGTGLSFVGTVASGVGVQIEETAAALGVLANRGLQGSRGGTALQRVISSLLNPTTEALEALTSLGVTQADVNIETRGLTAVLETLAVAGIGVTESLQIAGDRGGPALRTLTASVADVRALTTALDGAAGTSQEIASIMDANLNGAILRTRSALEAVVLSLGALQGSTLQTGFDALASAIGNVAENIELALHVSLSLVGALAAPRLAAIAGGLLAGATAAGTLATALGVATGAARFLGRALLIGFAIEGVQLLARHWDSISAAIGQATAALGDFGRELRAIGSEASALAGDLFGRTQVAEIDRLLDLRESREMSLSRLRFFTDQGAAVFFDDATIDARISEVLERLQQAGTRLPAALVEGIRASGADVPAALLEAPAVGAGAVPGAPAPPGAAGAGATPALAEGYTELLASLDPLGAAARQYAEDQTLLDQAIAAGALSVRASIPLFAELEARFESASQPFANLVAHYLDEAQLLQLAAPAREAELAYREAVLNLQAEGARLGPQELARLRDITAASVQYNRAAARQDAILSQLTDPVQTYIQQWTDLNQIVSRQPELLAAAEAANRAFALAALDAGRDLQSGFARAGLRLQDTFTDVASVAESAVTNSFSNMEDALVNFVSTGQLEVGNLISSIIADFARLAIRQQITGPLFSAFAGAIGGSFGFGGGEVVTPPAQRAAGGIIRGPGTGTSDSILARVSAGEYVVNAAATQRYLPLIESINSGVRAYQTGGLVGGSSRGIPALPRASGSGGNAQIVNVIDQRSSANDPPVEVSNRRGPDGSDIIDVVIPKVVSSGISSGRFDAAMNRRFNLSPSLR